jgi:glutamate---cysteine ligase / carboxylate-amine ligase
MDAQTTIEDVAAVAALVQSLARLELERPDDSGGPPAIEVIEGNRFVAARDGAQARLIDGRGLRRVPAFEVLEQTLAACEPHAERLGCEPELSSLRRIAASTGASRQLEHARDSDLRPVVAALAQAYAPDLAATLNRALEPARRAA